MLRITKAALAAFFGLAIAHGASAEEPIVLKFGSTAPTRAHLNVQVYAPWSERVTKASEGTLKVDFIPGSVLGGDGQMVERVKSGVADIGFDLQAYYPGKYPLTEIVSLPFLFTKSSQASVALWRLVSKGVIREYDDVVLINIFTFTNSFPMMRTDAKSLADLKGTKIAAGGKLRSQVVEALGATPVSVLINETYQSLNRGVVDGTMSPWTAIQPFRLQEVAKHYFDVPLGALAGFVFMNKQKFDSLPAKAKKAIMDNSGEPFVAEFGKFWDRIEDEGREIVRKSGKGTIIVPQGAELEPWKKAVEPVVAKWASETPHGAEALKAFRAELDQLSKSN
jgi:TRAP-type C4-dicarboxylate transport system substrate-binding protein